MAAYKTLEVAYAGDSTWLATRRAAACAELKSPAALIAASEGGAPVSRSAALTFVIDRATVSGNALAEAEAAAAMRTHPEQVVFG
jgi:hypothetical protein